MLKISVMELVVCLSEVIDLMSEEIRDHHKRVACGAYQLAKACGITGEERRDIVIAAALHDIGGLSLQARKNAALHFEDTNSHAEKGYKLLSTFAPFKDVANMVRYHHTHWNEGDFYDDEDKPIHYGSQIILMADRISVMIPSGIQTLTCAQQATQNIIQRSGQVFDPDLISIFEKLATKDIFWLNATSQHFYDDIMKELKEEDIILSGNHLEEMLTLISNIIDFRSPFTTMHSKGVALVAERMASLMGFSEENCEAIRIAALLHDIGKLAIPTEILDKADSLSDHERDIIRTHAYFTGKILSSLSDFEKIQEWASSHHENLNGFGYPCGNEANTLNQGSRIMKVADVFVALMEDRPYRLGMKIDEVFAILDEMISNQEVCPQVVKVLFDNKEDIVTLYNAAEIMVAEEYGRFSGQASMQ